MSWLAGKGFEILRSAEEAFTLGVNAMSLGDDRVLSTARRGAERAAARARAEVFDPDLTMFTLGGGGAHCLCRRSGASGWPERRRSTPSA